MPLQRSLNLLQPEFLKKVHIFLSHLDNDGIEYFINETLRSKEVQYSYYSQGREPLETTNRLRKHAGLYLLTEEENSKIITWTTQSKHILGLAIDVVPVRNKKLWWNAPDDVWLAIATRSMEAGLEPGYNWKLKDSPHHAEVVK